jgi:hypothetical protein
MNGMDERIERYPGLAGWWRKAEQIWLENRSSEKRTPMEQLDYMRQLSAQFPVAPWRVMYTKAGNTLAAATVRDHLGVIDRKLYWAAVGTRDEAYYLTAILNAPIINEVVKPYQSVGAYGPRDFDKYVWQAPIPRFIEGKASHQELVSLAADAASVAEQVSLSAVTSFQQARRMVRSQLRETGIAHALDAAVEELLTAP